MTTIEPPKIFNLVMLIRETIDVLREENRHEEIKIVEIKLQQILEGD